MFFRLLGTGAGGGAADATANGGSTAQPTSRMRTRQTSFVHCNKCGKTRTNANAKGISAISESVWFCERCVTKDPKAFENVVVWVYSEVYETFSKGTVTVSGWCACPALSCHVCVSMS